MHPQQVGGINPPGASCHRFNHALPALAKPPIVGTASPNSKKGKPPSQTRVGMKSGDLSANKNIQSGIRLALMADACNSRKVWVKIKDLHPQDCPLHFVSLVLIRQRRTDYF